MSVCGRLAAALLAAALALPAAPGVARPLAQLRESGTLALCAHPNALPFSARDGARHGVELELGAALAGELHVALAPSWITTAIDMKRAQCDIVLDAIAEHEAQEDLVLSRPYGRSGVALALRGDEGAVAGLADLGPPARIGVLSGSLASMTLGRRGYRLYPDIFEDQLLDDLAAGRIAAAAVTPLAIGYFNQTHPGHRLRLVDAFAGEPGLGWNIAVGMVAPDPPLRAAIDAALDRLAAAGTIAAIYRGYGAALPAPR